MIRSILFSILWLSAGWLGSTLYNAPPTYPFCVEQAGQIISVEPVVLTMGTRQADHALSFSTTPPEVIRKNNKIVACPKDVQ